MKKQIAVCLILLTSLNICAVSQNRSSFKIGADVRRAKVRLANPYMQDNQQEARQRSSAICKSVGQYAKFVVGSLSLYTVARVAFEQSLQSFSSYHNTTA